jgi:hypothetical protein
VGLVEIMLALTILSVVMMSLGGIMFQVARQTRVSAGVAFRSAAKVNASMWAQEVPWDSIPNATGWFDDTISGIVFRRSTSCDTGCPSSLCPTCGYRKVKMVITPLGTAGSRIQPDTVYVVRAKPRTATQLKVK